MTEQNAKFLMPTAIESLQKRHRETQMQGLCAAIEWMRWLQETKKRKTLTRTLVTASMFSSEALLQTKVSVANKNYGTSLLMNRYESTEQAPIASESNIGHTNQQEALTTESVILNSTSVSVLSAQKHVDLLMNPRILWVHWVKGRIQTLRHAVLENDWKWRLNS